MTKKLTFEDKLTRLEEIISKLDSEEINLDDSSKLSEEGVDLSKELTLEPFDAEGKDA